VCTLLFTSFLSRKTILFLSFFSYTLLWFLSPHNSQILVPHLLASLSLPCLFSYRSIPTKNRQWHILSGNGELLRHTEVPLFLFPWGSLSSFMQSVSGMRPDITPVSQSGQGYLFCTPSRSTGAVLRLFPLLLSRLRVLRSTFCIPSPLCPTPPFSDV